MHRPLSSIQCIVVHRPLCIDAPTAVDVENGEKKKGIAVVVSVPSPLRRC